MSSLFSTIASNQRYASNLKNDLNYIYHILSQNDQMELTGFFSFSDF